MKQLRDYCEAASGKFVIEQGEFQFMVFKKIKLPEDNLWRSHLILGVTHVKFYNRKIEDLTAAELAVIETH